MPHSQSSQLLAYTPMLHSRLFTETPKFRDNHFQPLHCSLPSPSSPDASAKPFLDGNPEIDRPLFVQFCANKPEDLLEAAKYVAPYCDAVDLNLGCPQGIARKGHYGAFLQEDQDLIFSLINTLHLNLAVPVTAKIRILDTKEATLAYARMVVRAGASILTIHGRTREMKGHKTGLADWKMIRFLREELGSEVVLFANGNILRKEDVDRCLEVTGADGVMSAEGNLYDPAIFADDPPIGEEGREFWRGKDGRGGWRMDAVMRRYMDILYKYVLEVPSPTRKPLYLPTDPEPTLKSEVEPQNPATETLSKETETNINGKRTAEEKNVTDQPAQKKRRGKAEKTTSPNLLAMQPHLFHLLRPLVAKHHNVRDALASCRAGDIAAFESVLQQVEAVVRTGLKAYHDTNGENWAKEMVADEEAQKKKEEERKRTLNLEINKAAINGEGEQGEEMDESSIETVKACKRPWWVVQPYVRPLPKEALAKGSLTLSRKERKKMEEAGVTGGFVEKEIMGEEEGKREQVEIPREGLVCG